MTKQSSCLKYFINIKMIGSITDEDKADYKNL